MKRDQPFGNAELRHVAPNAEPVREARIDELLQLLAALNAGEDGRAYVKARLATLYPAEYLTYCNRWRNVPGDHAPGRMLDFQRWQQLTAELANYQVTNPNVATEQRTLLLRRALLLGFG